MTSPHWRERLLVAVVFTTATFAGLCVTIYRFQVSLLLVLPSARPLGAQSLYGIATYWIVQPSLQYWIGNSVFLLLALWLLSSVLDQRQQRLLLLTGILTGAVVFEASESDFPLAGSSMGVYALLGGVVCYGWRRWRQIGIGWRVFVVWSAATILGQFVAAPGAVTVSGLASAIGGGVLTRRWLTRAESRHVEALHT